MMKVGPAAQVLQLVQERTGKPVHVEPDSSLPPNVLAKLDAARGGAPGIANHTSTVNEPDYIIAFQAGFLLRRFAFRAEERLDSAEVLNVWDACPPEGNPLR